VIRFAYLAVINDICNLYFHCSRILMNYFPGIVIRTLLGKLIMKNTLFRFFYKFWCHRKKYIKS